MPPSQVDSINRLPLKGMLSQRSGRLASTVETSKTRKNTVVSQRELIDPQ